MGQVTLDGKPVAGAEVVFFPRVADGLAANAATDTDGRFSLSTNDFPGVRPGHYKVLVAKRESPPVVELEREEKRGGPGVNKMKAATQSRNVLPEIYGDLQSTTLEFEVPPGGSDNLEIKLIAQEK
jgi:hypothetical protein